MKYFLFSILAILISTNVSAGTSPIDSFLGSSENDELDCLFAIQRPRHRNDQFLVSVSFTNKIIETSKFSFKIDIDSLSQGIKDRTLIISNKKGKTFSEIVISFDEQNLPLEARITTVQSRTLRSDITGTDACVELVKVKY